MPKPYTPAQKQEALRLLAFHNNNVPIVEQLTGISRSTLYYWRRQELSSKTDCIEQKNIPRPIGIVQQTEPPRPDAEPDPPPAEPKAGIPGLSYPYLLEDDDQPADSHTDFRKVRDILMAHVKYMADNLKPDEPDINRRSLALGRIIDRVKQLDEMLPSLMPEQVIRWEFVYDGMVHDKPPWQRTEEDLLAQLEIVGERKAEEARRQSKNAPDSQ